MFNYRLKKIAKLAKGKIIDIGFSLLPNPYLKGKEIIGVDIYLPDKKPENYSSMIKADVTKKLPFEDNSVDSIVLSGVLEHLENPLAALKEMNRVLKQNGKLLIEVPNPYFFPVIISDILMHLRYYFVDTHINLFPRRIVLKLLWHSGFDLDKIFGCGININSKITLPAPQQLSQDIIFVAIKRTPKNKRYKIIKKMRTVMYDECKEYKE